MPPEEQRGGEGGEEKEGEKRKGEGRREGGRKRDNAKTRIESGEREMKEGGAGIEARGKRR